MKKNKQRTNITIISRSCLNHVRHAKKNKKLLLSIITGCLIGILIMAYYIPQMTGQCNLLNTLTDQFCFHCSAGYIPALKTSRYFQAMPRFHLDHLKSSQKQVE